MKDKTTFLVEGLNINRLITCFVDNNIDIFQLQKSTKQATFDIRSSDKRKLIAILDKKCYNYTIIKSSGMRNLYIGIKNKALLLFGCLAVLVCCIVANNFIFDINIVVADDSFDKSKVLETLAEQGVRVGSKINAISLDNVENYLCDNIEDVSSASLRLIGCKLVVQLSRKIENVVIDINTPCDIISVSDGVVNRLVVISGTPQVKVGDRIAKGQLLIKGETVFNDGKVKPVRAAGEIYSTVDCVGRVEYTGKISVEEQTGQSISFSRLSLLNKQISSKIDIPFKQYKMQIKQAFFSIVPIKVEYVTVFQTHNALKDITLEEAMPILQQNAMKLALQNATFTPINEAYATVKEDGKIFITATVFADIQVGEYKS